MKNLRILFMGTPAFAVHALEKIIDKGFNVVGVVTAPDKPAGRGRKLQQSAVKEFALSRNLPVLQPTNLKAEEFEQELKNLNPNLQVVVAFRMLPKKVWQFPKYGTFNLHASLLPQYRGAAPINWAIIHGEEKTGVTTFFIDEKIDTGLILLQKEVNISKEDNAGSLHDKLMQAGANLIIETLELLAEEKEVKTVPQSNSENLKTAYKLDKNNTRIDWNKPGEEIQNLIRGLSPYPVAWTILQNGDKELKCKIYKSIFLEEEHSFKYATIIQEDKTLKVAVKEGLLQLIEIQLPGKRKMPVKDLLNGFEIKPNAKML